jgi:glycosyltransferase involved in cell wall biosynthesis
MTEIDVSVVVAVKNEEAYVSSAIHSILDQQGIAHEVIVIDDGSTDGTFAVLSEMQSRSPKLRVERNPRAGKCSAFNYGISLASGRFTCIFAGDDLMPAGSLAARLAVVTDLPDTQPVVGLCKLVTMSEIKRYDGHVVPRRPGRGALSGISPFMNQLALHTIFPVPESLPNEDTWMELAVLHLQHLTVVHSDIIGCQWRVHSGNSINMLVDFPEYNRKITARLKSYAMFLEQHANTLDGRGRRELEAKVGCEKARVAGSVLGVLRSNVGFVDRLRALSVTNGALYNFRRRMYGLFSGW